MSDSLRNVGSIAAGIAGFAIGASLGNPALGFALGTAAFNLAFPPRVPETAQGSSSNPAERSTAVDTPIISGYGRFMRVGGECIRCAKDNRGVRSGIKIETRSEKAGGGGSGKDKGKKNQVKKDYSYLLATFALSEAAFIEKIVERSNSKNNDRVIVDNTSNNFAGEWRESGFYRVDDVVKRGNNYYECISEHYGFLNTRPGDGEDSGLYWVGAIKPTDQLEFQRVYGPVSGDLIAMLSEKVRLYFGSEEQPIDSAEQTWYQEGVSADRGICKVVFNGYGPLEASTTFDFYLRNPITKKREIITHRLERAGIPGSRIYLRSIPENAEVYGWTVTGREPARNLAEKVAATEQHDLHFMPVATDADVFMGCAFTDISRKEPTIVVLNEDELGAFVNNGGGGEPVSSSAINLQSGETKPREISVPFTNWQKNMKSDAISVFWLSANGEPQSLDFSNWVASAQEASDFGEITMRELQAGEGTTEVTLMPRYSWVAPGCVLSLPEPSKGNPLARRLLRVISQSIAPEGVVSNTTLVYDPSALNSVLPVIDPVIEPPIELIPVGVPEIVWLDGVSIVDGMAAEPTVFAVATVGPDVGYRGAAVTTDTGAFDDFELPLRGTVGVTGAAFAYTQDELGGFLYDRTLRVTLDAGSLASVTEDAVNNKANILWVGGVYIAFTTATPVSTRVYDLSGLLVGLYGSDFLAPIPAGARVVKISDEIGNQDAAILAVEWSKTWLRRPVTYQAASTYNPLKETGDMVVTIQGNTLKALPVDPFIELGTSSLGAGVVLRFFVRSRLPESVSNYIYSGLPYANSDPLSCRVRLLDGANVVEERITTSSSNEFSVIFAEEDLIISYGGFPAVISGDITQLGTYGDGFTRAFSIPVDY